MSEVLEFTQGVKLPSERRRSARQRLRSLTYVELDKENGGIVLDASETGFSVQAVVSLMEDVLPQVRLRLPRSNEWLAVQARVVWTRESRKVAGLEFLPLSEATQGQIREWLSQEPAQAGAFGVESFALPEAHELGHAPLPGYGGISSGPAVVSDSDGTADPLSETGTSSKAEAKSTPEILTMPFSAARKMASEPGEPERSSRHPAAQTDVLARGADRRTEHPHAAPTYLVLCLLALISLAAGWAVGHGKFRAFAAKLQTLLPKSEQVSHAASAPSAPPITQIRDIEIVDLKNQTWTIPLQGPSASEPTAPKQTPAAIVPARTGPTPAQPKGINFQVWTLSPPQRSAKLGNAEAIKSDEPPELESAREDPKVSPIQAGSLVTGVSDTLPPPNVASLSRGALLRRVDPVYPEIARQQSISGTVVLNATVGPDGSVRGVTVVSGPKLLTQAAITAVRQWRYAPTMLDGKPIENQVQISLDFQLPSNSSH